MTGTTNEETQDWDHLRYLFIKDITCAVIDGMWKYHERCSKLPLLLAVHALSDHELAESLKYTLILLNICTSIDDSCNQIHFGIHSCSITAFFNVPQWEKKCCLNQKSKMARKPVHLAQSISDQTPNTNIHEHICHYVEVPHLLLKPPMASDMLWYGVT